MVDIGILTALLADFRDKYPARFAYQVAKLPLDALVEIDVIAIVGEVVDVQ